MATVAPEAARPARQELTPEGIFDAVERYYGFTAEDLAEPGHAESSLSDARTITMALLAEHTPLTLAKIAQMMQRSAGTNVGRAVKSLQVRAADDPKLREHIDMLRRAAAGEPLDETLATWPDLVTRHYDLSLEEITAGESGRALEARQVMAHLLVSNTVLQREAVARRTGYNRSMAVASALATLAERRRENPVLDRAVEQLETGELPEKTLTEEDVFERVGAFYGVTKDEIMGTEIIEKFTRPRFMAMHLLVRELGYDFGAVGRLFGRTSAPRDPLVRFEEQLAEDPRLQRHRAEILDPRTADREPAGRRILKTVCDFYGVDPDEPVEEHTAHRFKRPQAVAAYLMREKLGLSFREIKELLGRQERTATLGYRKVATEIEENPFLAAEVKYLGRVKNVRMSINDRLLMRISEATGVEREHLLNGGETASAPARRLAMALFVERGHMSPTEIVEFFGMADSTRATESYATIEYKRRTDAMLSQQLDYVRRRLFSEKPGTFTFDPNAVSEMPAVELEADDLPTIDERLVPAEIREQVYGIVRQTAEFYRLPAVEIIGHTQESELNRARSAAILLCHRAGIPERLTALCFDARYKYTLIQAVGRATDRLEDDSFFAEEIEALTRGEERRDVIGETLEAVAKFYHIDVSEIGSGEDFWATRARSVFLGVMDRLDYTTYGRLSETLGRPWENLASIAAWTRKRLEDDRRLAAEVEHLMDPETAPRPPGIDEILVSVCEAFKIEVSQLKEPSSEEEQLAKRLATYILIDELSLPQAEAGRIVRESRDRIISSVKLTKQEIAESPKRALEIDRLKPANATSLSMATRIVQLVAGRYKLETEDLTAGSADAQTPVLARARKMAATLLRQAEYTSDEVNEILSTRDGAIR